MPIDFCERLVGWGSAVLERDWTCILANVRVHESVLDDNIVWDWRSCTLRQSIL